MRPSAVLLGVLCGSGAALSWAAGFIAVLHGISAGLAPVDLTFHRFIWSGLVFLPFVFRNGLARPGGISWARGLALTLFGGPILAILSYTGFLLVPLGHAAVIQPSSAALGGLLLSTLILKESVSLARSIGAFAIVAGLCVYGGEAITTIGRHGLLGDLSFAAAGMSWSCFGLLLALWRIDPQRAVAVVGVITLLLYLPLQWLLFGFERLIAVGLAENLLQLLVQGVFAGPLAIYLFTRAAILLGPGRAGMFPALVPGFTMALGFLVLGEVPSLVQLAGFAIVTVGFRFALK